MVSGYPTSTNLPWVDGLLIGRKRDVYICTPMCASARVASSNIVYLWYGYRSTGISVVEYRDWLLNIIWL